jgi:hypothetical protein
VETLVNSAFVDQARAMARRMHHRAPAEARVEPERRLFELALSALMATIARTETSHDADTDMSLEAH